MSSLVDALKAAIGRHVDQQNAAKQKAAELITNPNTGTGGATK